MNLLTSLLDDAARFAEAEPLMRRNLDDCTSAPGPERRDHARRRSTSLASCSAISASSTRPRTSFATACKRQRKVLGAQHADTLRSINQLGLLLQDRGKLDEADSLAIEYEHGIRCLFGTKHPDNVTALANRGRVG